MRPGKVKSCTRVEELCSFQTVTCSLQFNGKSLTHGAGKVSVKAVEVLHKWRSIKGLEPRTSATVTVQHGHRDMLLGAQNVQSRMRRFVVPLRLSVLLQLYARALLNTSMAPKQAMYAPVARVRT